jgi:predicted TIM-barrel fold metal-dependent hydrolase
MELPSSDEVHRLTIAEFDTSKLLAHAHRQARQRKYSEFLIVDIDSHHYETDHALEVAFDSINAGTQLVWGSNFPAHDFDLPATIWDLPFLSLEAKKAILGGNAMRLFSIQPESA